MQSRPSSLTESEKKWQQHFQRQLEAGTGKIIPTPFLDPRQQELAECSLKQRPDLHHVAFGGYPGAERVCFNIGPAERHLPLPPVTALLITGEWEKEPPAQRDFLGAVCSLRLKRDQVGDIILLPGGGAAVIVLESIAPVVCSSLRQVGGESVKCEITEPAALISAGEKGREIKGTVASMRLDAVLSLGFGISRSRMVPLIKAGLVRVNFRQVDSPAFQLRQGDMISLRGKGCLELLSVEGATRKGRQRVLIKKFPEKAGYAGKLSNLEHK